MGGTRWLNRQLQFVTERRDFDVILHFNPSTFCDTIFFYILANITGGLVLGAVSILKPLTGTQLSAALGSVVLKPCTGTVVGETELATKSTLW